ncbi:SDR family NAD(P)-dependent oxidoreductase [uncultured Sphaerochaeta sp.]|uniref:SDR family NAD(P)-dependent oxidoreductase n=1 Tax=uncultured Sphaerochaeta sp. TaxID=886478 RepID=UPI002A0A2906|nr:SDR family NAD(P)-dependent oxidoreductase [uncultured Sphaerochaeta sp.]
MLNSIRLLEGKNIVITGCLRGIGRRTLEVFARNGANIWACAQYSEDEFEDVCLQLAIENEVIIKPVYFDFLDTDALKTGMKAILSEKKPIDGLVNIAGLTYNALLQMTSMEKMKQCFDIDYFSQILITQYVAKMMIRQKSGAIVSVSSVAGLDGNPGQVAYSGCKAALIGSTKTMAEELGEFGIRVNAVAPGVIETDMTADLEEKALNRLLGKIALARKGTPEEVANVLLFLISDMSSFVTGQIIRIDGGMN